jgi:hypothetical protein
VNVGYMQEFMKRYRENPTGAAAWAAAKVEGISPKTLKAATAVGAKWDDMMSVLVRSKEFTETFHGPLLFLHELEVQLKAGMPQREAEQAAAYITKRVLPGKSERSQAVTAFGKHPASALVAPFIGFKSEMFRSVAETWMVIQEELESDSPVIRANGRRRLAWTTLVQGGITVILPLLWKALSGITDDEDQLIRASLPAYAKNSSYWYYHDKANKSISLMDMTYVIPWSINFDTMTQIVSAVAAKDSRPEDIPAIFGRFFGEELVGEQIVAGKVFDLMRNKDESTGNEIWRNDEDMGAKLFKAGEHVLWGVPSLRKSRPG